MSKQIVDLQVDGVIDGDQLHLTIQRSDDIAFPYPSLTLTQVYGVVFLFPMVFSIAQEMRAALAEEGADESSAAVEVWDEVLNKAQELIREVTA